MLSLLQLLKNHLLPHKGNDFKPHVLRHQSLLFFLSLTLLIESLFLLQTFVLFGKTNLLADVLPAVLTSLTNEDRKENDATPLEYSDLLQKAAQLKAEDMALRGYFSHTTPDGKLPWYFLDQVGYKYSYAGENLAVNFFDSKDVAEAWMKSPTHKANVLNKEYTEMGIGVASGIYEGKNTIFVAEFFGSQQAPVEIVNTSSSREQTQIPAPKPTSTKVLGETTTANLAVQKIAASPRYYTNYIYGGIISFIFLVLLVFLVKSEKRHPSIILRGVSLVVFVGLVFFFNTKILSLHTEIGSESITSNTIAY